jgi:hypothetical protein
MVIFVPFHATNLRSLEQAFFAVQRLRNESTKLRKRPLLVIIDMALALAYEFIAWRAVATQRDLIRHRSARHEDRSLFAKQLCCLLLQRNDGWINIDHVVPYFGREHRVSHGWSGLGDRIASKINHGKQRITGVD